MPEDLRPEAESKPAPAGGSWGWGVALAVVTAALAFSSALLLNPRSGTYHDGGWQLAFGCAAWSLWLGLVAVEVIGGLVLQARRRRVAGNALLIAALFSAMVLFVLMVATGTC